MTPNDRIKQEASEYQRHCERILTMVPIQPYEHYIAGATATHDRVQPIVDALRELIELKKMKDELGKTTNYLTRQPEAWKQAIKALEQWKGKEVAG